MFSNYFIKIPDFLLLIIGLLCAYALTTANPVYTIISLLFIPLMMKLLWRVGEPPVLFFGTFIQWLSITIKVFYADYLGVDFIEIHLFPKQIEKAFELSLAGVLFFSLGVHLAIRHIRYNNSTTIIQEVRGYNTRKTTYAYIFFSLAFPIFRFLSGIVPGLQQPFVKVMELKWAFFYLLFAVVFLKSKNRQNFYLILAIEIILGFTGYFSSFKDFIIITAISYFSFGIRLKPFQYVTVAIAAVFTFNLSVIWTHVKPSFRSYLSGGEQAQVVKVSSTDALSKITELTVNMTQADFDASIVELIDRISYIEYFSASIDYIPTYLPHQNGQVWLASIQHVLLPRILFPNKPSIDDSEQTAKYTGLYISGKDKGTSISLGYMAESYVDMGENYMFIPIFLLGFVIGCIYKYLLTQAFNRLWGQALVMPLFYSVSVNGLASIKIIGGLIMYFLVVLLVNRYGLPWIDHMLKDK